MTKRAVTRCPIGMLLLFLLALFLSFGMEKEVYADNETVVYQKATLNADKTVSFNEARVDDYKVIRSDTKDWGSSGGELWYVLSSNVTIDEPISVEGTVNLILMDGCTLTANDGIKTTGATLNVFGQTQGSGKLKADNSYNFYCAGIGGGKEGDGGTITIYGGKVIANGATEGAGIGGGKKGGGGRFTIYGGEVTANGGSGGAGIGGGNEGDGGTITIYGGKVTANGTTDGAGIGGGKEGDGGRFTIYGGEVTANGGGGGAGIGGGNTGSFETISIHGGTISANGGSRGAGIGGGNTGFFETISIHGGTITANGGSGGAGIGGGNGGSFETISIHGGTITVNGGFYAPGIGGGNGGSFKTISIHGGTIIANGGEFGPGIGGCAGGSFETISIHGGTIIANGGQFGPGIGGCAGVSFETISIHGGTITAIGGHSGAGIGGGNGGSFKTISIHGGTITANGGDDGAGIGGGKGGPVGTVNIYLGEVSANGGIDGAGIGGGKRSSGGIVKIHGGKVSASAGNYSDGYVQGEGIGGGAFDNRDIDERSSGDLILGERVIVFDNAIWEGNPYAGGTSEGTSVDTRYADMSTLKMVTVSFNASGHGTAPSDQTIVPGKKAERPADPAAKGYAFDGWYTDQACTKAYDFDTEVREDIVLYAKWILQYHSIIFDVLGHGKAPSSQTVLFGDKANRPGDPAAKGYIFDGWYVDQACTKAYDFDTEVTEDIVLYAKWTESVDIHATTAVDITSVSPDADKYGFDAASYRTVIAKTRVNISEAFESIRKSDDYDETARHRYVSSDKRVAKVSRNGSFTAKKAGEVDITLEQKKKGGKWTQLGEKMHYYVQKPAMVKKASASVSDRNLSVFSFLSRTTFAPTRWVSSKRSVASVDKKGNITIYKAGTTDIIAQYGRGGRGSRTKYRIRLEIK